MSTLELAPTWKKANSRPIPVITQTWVKSFAFTLRWEGDLVDKLSYGYGGHKFVVHKMHTLIFLSV